MADTHALLWFLRSSPHLSENARLALRDAQDSDGIVVSTALLVDLWYVTQTTEAFSTGDLDVVIRDPARPSPAGDGRNPS